MEWWGEGGGVVNDPDATAALDLGLHGRVDRLTVLDLLVNIRHVNTIRSLTI